MTSSTSVAYAPAIAGRARFARGLQRATASDVSTLVRWAFCGFMFSIPIEYPDRSFPLEVHTITGSLFLLTAVVQPKVCFRRPPAAIWLIVPYLWMYLAHTLFSDHVADALKLFFNYFLVAALFWVGSNLMRRERIAREAFASFAAGCVVIAALNVLGIAGRVVISDQAVRRTVFGQNADLLGANMALGLVVLMVLAFGPGRWWRVRVVTATAAAFVLAKSLMLVSSRGAIVGVAIGVLAFTVNTTNVRLFARNLAIALVASAALSVAVYRSGSMMKRYQKTFETGSLSGRERIYPEAWQMFLDRPLFGWGPVDATFEMGRRTAGDTIGQHNADGISANPARETHNLALEVLTSMGVAGAAPIFLCMALSILTAWAARTGPRGTAPLTLVMTVLILSMNINWAASKQLWIVLAYAASSRQLRTA